MQVSASSNASSLAKIPMSLSMSPATGSQDRKVEAVERREPQDEDIAAEGFEAPESPDVDPVVEGKLDKLKLIQYAFGKAMSINQLLEDELIFEPVL